MPLLDHFHPPLHGPRRWEGFHHAWATFISTGLYAVANRAVTARKGPRLEVWPEPLALGEKLPVLPLWLALDLCVPVRLEDSYLETCRSLRISA